MTFAILVTFAFFAPIAVTVIANVVLIRLFGLMGAAAATALGLFVWNLVLSWFTWERLGILPAAFSWRWLRW